MRERDPRDREIEIEKEKNEGESGEFLRWPPRPYASRRSSRRPQTSSSKPAPFLPCFGYVGPELAAARLMRTPAPSLPLLAAVVVLFARRKLQPLV